MAKRRRAPGDTRFDDAREEERWPHDICEQLQAHSFCIVRFRRHEAVTMSSCFLCDVHVSCSVSTMECVANYGLVSLIWFLCKQALLRQLDEQARIMFSSPEASTLKPLEVSGVEDSDFVGLKRLKQVISTSCMCCVHCRVTKQICSEPPSVYDALARDSKYHGPRAPRSRVPQIQYWTFSNHLLSNSFVRL